MPGGLVRRAVAVAMLVGAALLWGAGPAAAHNTLVSADPTDGTQLATGPSEVTLTFDQPVQGGFNTITVTGPGDTRWNTGDVTTSGNTASTAVAPLGPTGDYVIGYRVVSADGHPVTGSLRFQLTQAGTGTPVPASAPDSRDDSGLPLWPWILLAVALLAAGVVAALRLARPPSP